MLTGNVLVVLKHWSSTVDEEKKRVIDYRMVYGKLTEQNEKAIVLGDKLAISRDSILSVEKMEKEPPKDMLIPNWDMKEYKEIEAKTPIYIVN